MLHDRVHRLRLLQLKEQLLHGLNGGVAAQIYSHLFNLRRKTGCKGCFPEPHLQECGAANSKDGGPCDSVNAPPVTLLAHLYALLGRTEQWDCDSFSSCAGLVGGCVIKGRPHLSEQLSS